LKDSLNYNIYLKEIDFGKNRIKKEDDKNLVKLLKYNPNYDFIITSFYLSGFYIQDIILESQDLHNFIFNKFNMNFDLNLFFSNEKLKRKHE
jgi:hypothetical protein